MSGPSTGAGPTQQISRDMFTDAIASALAGASSSSSSSTTQNNTTNLQVNAGLLFNRVFKTLKAAKDVSIIFS